MQHLTIAETCERLKIGRTRLYALLNAGEIPAIKIGRLTRIREEDVAAYAERLDPYRPRDLETSE
jgi:excisionase family DNA binding protein